MPYFSVPMLLFVVWILCHELRIYLGKISFISSCGKPILTLKISATNFSRFQYFADFDFEIALLG